MHLFRALADHIHFIISRNLLSSPSFRKDEKDVDGCPPLLSQKLPAEMFNI